MLGEIDFSLISALLVSEDLILRKYLLYQFFATFG